ncbi:MAG TPA: hypothetical protein VLT82_13210 [Myxococcaceae bacterium]|nr:hypothetical protein [Myxococcaceae bacterium]
MKAKYLPLLLLGLLPMGSSSPAASVPPSELSEAATAVGEPATEPAVSERCVELRDTEAALAEQEVHLLDQLALPDARPLEKEALREQLDSAQDALEDLDKELETHRCPTHAATFTD